MADSALQKKSTESQALETIPDWMENAPQDDPIEPGQATIPRLAIAQGMSPAMQPKKPEYIKGLNLGDLFNTLTGENYGPGPLEFAVVQRRPSRWMEFDADRNLIDRDVPPGDRRCEWRVNPDQSDPKKRRLPPIATEFREFVVVLLDRMEPIAISCAKSNISAANDLLGLIQLRKPKIIAGKPMRIPEFAMKFTVHTAQEDGPSGSSFGVFVFKPAGDMVNEPELARVIRQFRDQFTQTTFEIHQPTVDDVTPAAGEGSSEPEPTGEPYDDKVPF